MKQLFKDETPQERLRLLRENCDSHEHTTYFKDLTAEEVASKNAQLIDNLILINRETEKVAQVKKEFKLKTDPLVEINKTVLMEVKTGKQEVEGTLFHLANHEEQMMETYDENGYLVRSRRLRPEEKQGRLFVASEVRQASNQ